MSFNEYKSAVAKELLDYGYTKEEIDKFINKPKIAKTVRETYEEYSEDGTAGCESVAVASCLDMMYE